MKYRNFKKSYITKNDSNFCTIKNYVSSNDYSEHMIKDIEPILNSLKKSGYITGINNMKLYYEKYIVEHAKASIVICHGIGEYTEKYNEIMYYFITNGYSVFIIEHRGNGRSGRL
ncbi:MAG: alpha/beta hydrolase, partial [Clostridium sp.]